MRYGDGEYRLYFAHGRTGHAPDASYGGEEDRGRLRGNRTLLRNRCDTRPDHYGLSGVLAAIRRVDSLHRVLDRHAQGPVTAAASTCEPG